MTECAEECTCSRCQTGNYLGSLINSRRQVQDLEAALDKIAAIEDGKRKRGIGYDDEIYQIAVLFKCSKQEFEATL